MKQPIVIFAANHKDDEVRMHSSSGGAFYALARYVIECGGVVIGAAYIGTDVEHIMVDNLVDLELLRKSKYAPSSMVRLYKEKAWRNVTEAPVLFSGTPCQVKAFKLQNIDRANILYVEIACHGVPTRESYQTYIQDNDIVRIDFRCKRNGWRESEIELVRKDGTILYERPLDNAFYKAFHSGENIRNACFECKAKYFSSGADITLADFWGVEAFAKNLDDKKGTSLVLIHTKNGVNYWNKVSSSFNMQRMTLHEAVKWNYCVLRPLNSEPTRLEKWLEWKHNTRETINEIINKIIR